MADPRSFSRRSFLTALAGTATATALAACGQQAPSAPARPSADKPAVPAAVLTTVGAAEPVTADADLTTPGVLNFWFDANWNKVTDEALGNIFVEWGNQNGVKVEWQAIRGSSQVLSRQAAAVAAGQPPELTATNLAYWYAHGELADLSDLVNQFRIRAGGMYPIALDSQLAPDGGLMGAPFAIDVWPAHWRTDEIGKVTGGKFFETWDELIELGPAAQRPPHRHAIAFALGHEADHLNNICTVLWGYGGRIADEQGVPDIENPANKAGIETIVRMGKAKLIPPDTFAQTASSWNNETYQQGRASIAINPVTIMGWLLVHEPELAERTGLARVPRGPAGSFAEGDALAVNYFKRAPLADRAAAALEHFLQPANLLPLSRAVEGRFVPVYRDHASGEFWEKGKFAELKAVAEHGRVREWPAPRQPWLHDVQDARYIVSDMLNKIVNENVPIEYAQARAQRAMIESYSRLARKV